MTYYRALKQLWHTVREAAGDDPIIPAGNLVSLDHLTGDQRMMLCDMGAVEEVSADVAADLKAAEMRRWLDAQAGSDAETVEALTGIPVGTSDEVPEETPEGE